MIKLFKKIIILSLFISFSAFAINVPMSVFPLSHYNQNVDYWVNAKNFPNFKQPLLTPTLQKAYQQNLITHWLSPWNPKFVSEILQSSHPSIDSIELDVLKKFNNNEKKLPREKEYGSNFKLHTTSWLLNIQKQIKLDDLSNLAYTANNRAIFVTNAAARALPTNEVSFYQFTLPGEGYPFDNLQMSSVWAGTPAYIISQTNNKAWTLILTPSIIAWVPSNTIAKVDQAFVNTWSTAAKNKLAAIKHTQTSITGLNSNRFYLTTYVGTVLPMTGDGNNNTILFPIKNSHGFAQLTKGHVDASNIAVMPYLATPEHIAGVMKTLIGRPYGWGGVYFHNDCSQELKSLYAVFGIWLPRHSSKQMDVGAVTDETQSSTNDRIQSLMTEGHPLMTIVYIGGHIFMYVGNFTNPNNPNGNKMALTYQNVWGLSPADHDRRALIGQAALLPLLRQYPEDISLASLAAKSDFKMANIDQPNKISDDQVGAPLKVDLESMMSP